VCDLSLGGLWTGLWIADQLFSVLLIVGEREDVQPESMECDDVSMERISTDLVTFSQLPPSRWKNLLNLDVIRVTNGPSVSRSNFVNNIQNCAVY